MLQTVIDAEYDAEATGFAESSTRVFLLLK